MLDLTPEIPPVTEIEEGGLAQVRAQERLTEKPSLFASPGLGNWLKEEGGSLAFTTYQSARLFLLSAGEDGKTQTLERIMGTAMGLAVERDRLWVSNHQQVWHLANIGPHQLDKQDFDAVYMPRRGYLLGGCNTHDILANVTHRGQHHELLFANTCFSCIAAIDNHYNFRPVWKPDFISELEPSDRCHLNGIAARDGELTFATLCGLTDTAMGWKEGKSDGGCVIDITTNRILCKGLSMPHSPRWHHGRLWLLNSGNGDFGYLEPTTGKFVAVGVCPGFARGLCFVGNYAVIGISKLRESPFASSLPLRSRLKSLNIRETCGLLVVDPQTGKLVHWLTIEGSVTELYDVAFLPGVTRPYTPGFSEPGVHKTLFDLPPDPVFPRASIKMPTSSLSTITIALNRSYRGES